MTTALGTHLLLVLQPIDAAILRLHACMHARVFGHLLSKLASRPS